MSGGMFAEHESRWVQGSLRDAARLKTEDEARMAWLNEQCRKADERNAPMVEAARKGTAKRKRQSVAEMRAANTERMRALRAANVAAGRCPCGKPREPGSRRCPVCRDLSYRADVKRGRIREAA